MDDLHVMPVMRAVLLAVLFTPLAAAAVCAALRNTFVRRFSLLFALTHLGLTAGLVTMGYVQLGTRTESRDFGFFQPLGVPGDRGYGTADPNAIEHETSWDLLTLGATPAGPRVAAPAIQFFVGLDGFNVWLVALSSLMTLVAVLASWDGVSERRGLYYAWLFVLETGVIGAFVAFDVILFYVFFELTLIPAFFLIGSWGVGAARREAARKFFLYTLLGSLLTLTGVIGIVLTHPTPLVPQAIPGPNRTPMLNVLINTDDDTVPAPDRGPLTFSIPRLMRNVETWASYYAFKVLAADIARFKADKAATAAEAKAASAPADVTLAQAATAARAKVTTAENMKAEAKAENDRYQWMQTWLFVALMAGFAVKIPILPFHTWLPPAYGEAPLGVTVILSAVLSKLGTFGVLRLVLPLAPDAALAYGLPVFGALGAAGIVYAALCAYAQRDIKLLVAYSSVSHLGFLVIGLFTLTPEGVSGAALHMVNHGLSTGAMFALLAFLSDRYRTLDSAQYGGLWARFPGYTFLFVVVCLASIGLPGLNNFVSEMLMLAGAVAPMNTGWAGYWPAIAAVLGILLSAWYTLTLVRRVLFGPLREPPTAAAPPAGLSRREWVAFGLPAALCLVLGLMPQPLLDSMAWDTRVLVHTAEAAKFRANPPKVTDELIARIAAAEEFRRQMGAPGGGGPPGGVPKGGPPKGGPPKGGPAKGPKQA